MQSKIKEAFENKNFVLVKNAINIRSFGLDFDFNSMYDLFNVYPNFEFTHKGSLFISQIGNVVNNATNIFFNAYLTHLKNIFKNIFPCKFGKLDFFYSIKGERGNAHIDDEHVIILGVYKNTYYHIKGEDIKISPGDILFIHKGILHHAFSSTERIVLSLSIWENND